MKSLNVFERLSLKPYLFVFLFFGILYCLISLVNHYYFRTYGFDLGIINNSIWDYAHFRWNSNTIMQPAFDNLLSDHFTLLPILFSPLYWIFGSYTLLIVQVSAILWGGYGIYKLILLKFENQLLAVLATIQFFSMWGIYTALGFDYHDNVIAAALLPFFFYYLEKRQWRNTMIYFALILISKENMALWMFFVCLGTAWLYRYDLIKRNRMIIMAIVSALYLILIIIYIIPFLGNADREYLHFHYSTLGTNMKEAFVFIFKNLYDTFLLLFNDPTNSGGDIYKKQLHVAVLLSGGVFLFFRPVYFFMLIPIYAQKLFNDDIGKWGVTYHYSIEFAPILVLATYDVIQTINWKSVKITLAVIAIATTMYTSYIVIEEQAIWWQDKNNLQFYSKDHYTNKDLETNEIYHVLSLIPKEARVSAQSPVVSHLAFRDKIYQYPVVEDAQYLLLLPSCGNVYPLSKEEYAKKLEEFLADRHWTVVYKSQQAILFKCIYKSML